MSVDYQAVVIVGLKRKDFIGGDNLEELIDSGAIEVCAPYYDGDGDDDAVVGFSVSTSRVYGPSEFHWNQEDVNHLKDKFRSMTGLDAKVYLSPRGF